MALCSGCFYEALIQPAAESSVISHQTSPTISINKSHPICEPWCWYIYLHDWVIFMVNVGRKIQHHGAFGHDIAIN
jgi:hypothetical protein